MMNFKEQDQTKNLIDQKTLDDAIALLEQMQAVDTEGHYHRVMHSVRRKKRKKLFTRLFIGALSASAAAVAAVLLLSPQFGDIEYPKAEQQIITAGSTHAVLTVGDGHQVLLTQQDNESTWEAYVGNNPDEHQVAQQEVVMIKIDVPRGGEYKLRLPDGTIVWLNAQTVIEYPSKFVGKNRSVKISGEAYFDVAHNPNQPFVITTPDQLELAVLGTQFNVNSYGDRAKTMVTLVEGSLRVSNTTREVTLEPSNQAVFNRDDQSFKVANVDTRQFTAWKDGLFYYRSTSLDVIFAAMERWYDVDIVSDKSYRHGAGDLTIKVSRRDNLNDVLAAVKKITGVNYRIEGKTIYITNP